MANEYRLSYTASEIDEKLSKMDEFDIIKDKTSFIEVITCTSKNLFNPNSPDWLVGYKMNIYGVISEDSTRILSNFVPVEPGETLIYSMHFEKGGTDRQTFTGKDWYYHFDENKNFIGYTTVPEEDGNVFTVPEGVAYIRYAIMQYEQYSDYMLERGTEITNYEPYFEPYTIYKIPRENLDVVIPQKTSELENDAGYIRNVSKPLALPPTLYGFVGVPMSLYHYNIMDYNLNDVYIRMITTAKGTLKAKKWEWTPDMATNFSIYYNIFNHDYDVLNNREQFQVVIKDSSEKTSLKVLVLGDSTVFHGYETEKMLDLATADGYDLTLLGTRGKEGSLNQHEGRGGWTASMYVNNASNSSGSVVNAFYNPETSTFDFGYYMTQQGYDGVDCVFIQLGINDVFSATTDKDLESAQNTFYTNLDKMIASIHEYNSNVKIVINTVIPSDTDQDAFSEYYPTAPTVWINHHNVYSTNRKTIERYANKSNVYVSWYSAMIDVDNNMQGDVHPNSDGYAELGTQMYGFMRAIN